MTTEDFKKIVEEKTKESKQAGAINWPARKREWLRELNEFYRTIETFLADFIKAGTIKIQDFPVSLTEDSIGTYDTKGKKLLVGLEELRLTPVGTLLIGTRGRVDMEGPAGRAMFILTGKDSNGIRISITESSGRGGKKSFAREEAATEKHVWKIATPPPKVHFIELTRESFFDALTETLNG